MYRECLRDRFVIRTITRLAFWVALAALVASGCHKKPARPNIASPVAKPPAPAAPLPVPMPTTWPELPLPPSHLPGAPDPVLPKSFGSGETSFRSGKYAEAVPEYERYLKEDPVTQYRETAMFRLGISLILSCNSDECRARTMVQSRDLFRRLIYLYPASPYSAEARVILGLTAYVEKLHADARSREEKLNKLSDELERLKKIDLERQPPRKKK